MKIILKGQKLKSNFPITLDHHACSVWGNAYIHVWLCQKYFLHLKRKEKLGDFFCGQTHLGKSKHVDNIFKLNVLNSQWQLSLLCSRPFVSVTQRFRDWHKGAAAKEASDSYASADMWEWEMATRRLHSPAYLFLVYLINIQNVHFFNLQNKSDVNNYCFVSIFNFLFLFLYL